MIREELTMKEEKMVVRVQLPQQGDEDFEKLVDLVAEAVLRRLGESLLSRDSNTPTVSEA